MWEICIILGVPIFRLLCVQDRLLIGISSKKKTRRIRFGRNSFVTNNTEKLLKTIWDYVTYLVSYRLQIGS